MDILIPDENSVNAVYYTLQLKPLNSIEDLSPSPQPSTLPTPRDLSPRCESFMELIEVIHRRRHFKQQLCSFFCRDHKESLLTNLNHHNIQIIPRLKLAYSRPPIQLRSKMLHNRLDRPSPPPLPTILT